MKACKLNILIITSAKFLAMSPTCPPSSHYNLKESPITLATTKFLQYLFQYLMKKKNYCLDFLYVQWGWEITLELQSSIGSLSFVVKGFLNIFLETFFIQ
jgi:hypothetical protein